MSRIQVTQRNRTSHRIAEISCHALLRLLAEINRVRQAIRDGVLWELVDERCRSSCPASWIPALLGYNEELVALDRETNDGSFTGVTKQRTEVLQYTRWSGGLQPANRH